MQKELCGGAREVGDEKRWRDLRIEQEKCRGRGWIEERENAGGARGEKIQEVREKQG